MDARVVIRDHNHCVAIWGHVLIQLWFGETRPAVVREMSRACEALLRTAAGDASLLVVVTATAPVPGGESRKVLAEWSRGVVCRFAKAAVVAEGSGFHGSVVRGVGLAFTTLTPHRLPFKFFATVAEGAAYLSPALREPGEGPDQLEVAVASLRMGHPAGASVQRRV